MVTNRTLAALLALTLGSSLGGCGVLPTDLFGSLTPQQNAAVKSTLNDTLTALHSDADMNVTGGMANDSTYRTQGIELGASTSISATASAQARENERLERFMQKAKAWIDEARVSSRNLVRSSTTNEGGTRSDKLSVQLELRFGTQTREIEKIYLADGTLIEIKSHIVKSNKSGHKIEVYRDRKLNSEGYWTTYYKCELTRRDGKVKLVEWNRTELADGSESGEGKIVRFDGTVVTMTMTRTADGTVITKTVDGHAQVDIELSKDEASNEAHAKVTDRASGRVAGSASLSGTADTEASER